MTKIAIYKKFGKQLYTVLELVILTNGNTSLEHHKITTFHWLLHTRFSDLLLWTVVIGAMLKIGFGKKCIYKVL